MADTNAVLVFDDERGNAWELADTEEPGDVLERVRRSMDDGRTVTIMVQDRRADEDVELVVNGKLVRSVAAFATRSGQGAAGFV